jgi:hypothetical protein
MSKGLCWNGFAMVRLTMQDVLNIKQFCHGKLNKHKQKMLNKLEHALILLERPLWVGFCGEDFFIFRPR